MFNLSINRRMGFSAAVTVFLFGVSDLSAATVSVVGSVSDNAGSEVTGWRTSGTVKTFDLAGNNIYGGSGYSIFRGNQGGGGATTWNTQILEQQVSGLSLMQAGSLGGDGTLSLLVGDFNGATDWDDPFGGTRNMGYAGPRREQANVASLGAVPLVQAFTYSVTEDFTDTLRMGIAADGLGDVRVPLANLRVVAGGSQADATIVANPANASPDMYFFDLDGLQSGDTIEIWMEGVNAGHAGNNFSFPTINGVTFDQALTPLLAVRVDRQTGQMTLDAENLAEPLNIVAYSIRSESGALDPGQWTSISGNYDKVGNGGNASVDPDDAWTRLTSPSSRGDLSEGEFDGLNGAGNGAILGATNQSIDLGNPWIQNPTEDLQVVLKLADGTNQPLLVEYTGDAIPLGDLNFDGVVNAADWPTYRNNFGANLAGLSVAESYQRGDLNGDGDNDELDFALFKTAFESQPGNGSLAAMIARVPEPNSLLILIAACVMAAGFCALRRPARQPVFNHVHSLRGKSMSLARRSSQLSGAALLAAVAIGGMPQIHAATVSSVGSITDDANAEVTEWRTDSTTKTLDVDGDGIYGSTGYSIFRGNQGGGGAVVWNTGIAEQQVLGLSLMQAGSLNGDETLTLRVGDFNGAADWDDPTNPGSDRNMGYAGPRREAVMGSPSPAVELVQAFTYQATLNFDGPVRMGIAADGLGDARVQLSALRVVVGGSQADATLVATPQDPIPDMYFFDIADLLAGDVIEIHMAGVEGSLGNPFSFPTINGVTFDGMGVNPLTLQVNTVTGQMNMLNTSMLNAFDIDLLKITSESDSLAPGGWNSLTNQDFEGSGTPNDTGDGWEELGTPHAGELAEAFLQGSSSIQTSSSIDLGTAYDTEVDGQDLNFLFRMSNGLLVSGLVEYVTPDPVPGDYNANGIVDAADYTIWRDNLGASIALVNEGTGISPGQVTQADYDFWKSRFGATSGSGSLTAAAVPEPASALLALLGLAAVGGFAKRRRVEFLLSRATIGSVVVTTVAWAVVGSTALAAVTNDREYWFGEDSLEGTADGALIGFNNTAPLAAGNTADSKGPLVGTFLDLERSGEPKYANVGPGGGLARPGAAVGEYGARFHGFNESTQEGDLLTGIPLNRPDELEVLVENYPIDYTGIIGSGMQMWVYPDESALGSVNSPTTFQSIVADTTISGGPAINEFGQWTQLNGNHPDVGGPIPAAVDVPAGNTWYHLMHHKYHVAGNTFQSVLYVDGVAVSANQDGIPLGGVANFVDQLVVGGAEVVNDGVNAAYGKYFTGVVDDLEMYVHGNNETGSPGNLTDGEDWGTFDLFADNHWIAQQILDTVPGQVLAPGDVNKDGMITNSDVTAFVLGWLKENTLEGAHGTLTVGDWNTWDDGDMNHDGITDLDDAFILHEALLTAGAGGLDFSLLGRGAIVPEPSSVALALVGVASLGAMVRRRLRR